MEKDQDWCSTFSPEQGVPEHGDHTLGSSLWSPQSSGGGLKRAGECASMGAGEQSWDQGIQGAPWE